MIESPLKRAVMQKIDIAAIVTIESISTLIMNQRGTASDHWHAKIFLFKILLFWSMNSDYLEKARIVELPEIVSDKKARSGDFDTDSIRLTSLVASMASL